MSDEATRADGVTEAVPALIVGVVPSHQDILVAQVVRPLVDNPGPGLHSDGVTTAEVGAELGTVAAAFVETALKIFILIEKDLQQETAQQHEISYNSFWQHSSCPTLFYFFSS